MSKHRKREQKSKAERGHVEHVQNLRRGSTAQPHRNKSRYTRKDKYPQRGWEE